MRLFQASAGSSRFERPLWQPLLGAGALSSVALYLLLTSQYTPLKGPNRSSAKLDDGGTTRRSPFYEWQTISAFPPLDHDVVANATVEDLCRHFPREKLVDVQPVLKTGHGVMHRVRESLKSTSACLDNLLIFSDLAEEVEGHAVIDIINDIPRALLEEHANQTGPYLALHEAAAQGPLDEATMSGVEGWKTDKFKFLPAVSRAWRMAPEKRWYVFFEGDTYIVWDTVFRLLANFDADIPQYFGSPSPGRVDGGITTWFANGGPGYILSRGAMRKLIEDDWDSSTGEWLGSKLSQKHWGDVLSDCCGDSILGWALHTQGVDLKGLWPLFNPHPLHGVPFSQLYFCQPVLSMHKSTDEDIVKLWNWEWAHRGVERPILYRDLAVSYLDIANLTRRTDWDNHDWDAYAPAHDDPNKPHDSPENCELACEKAVGGGCFQWTYHLKKCSFVRSFRLGRARDPFVEKEHQGETWSLENQRYTAGWNQARIRRFISETPCEQVEWVKPSIKRIF